MIAAGPCEVGRKHRVGDIEFISSGTFDRILDVPKMVQYREPFLHGILRKVGFGKSFAYKLYCSQALCCLLHFNCIET